MGSEKVRRVVGVREWREWGKRARKESGGWCRNERE